MRWSAPSDASANASWGYMGPANYPFDDFDGSAPAGASKLAFSQGFGSDYQGDPCGYYVRAVNGVGASTLVKVAGFSGL